MPSAGVPLVSKEQAFLETYFLSHSKFAYDKAKDLSEKEKEASKNHPSILWTSCLNQLVSLAVAEKAYTSLVFLCSQNLSKRFLGRRDNLKTTYSHMLTEFRRMEESTRKHVKSGNMLDSLLGHLSGHLCHFITARLKTMEFYEQTVAMAQSKVVSFEDLLNVISEIIQSHQKNFHHPILSPIKCTFSLECDVMYNLLMCQMNICRCQFLPSLLHLHDAHSKLISWAGMAVTRDQQGKKLSFGASSRSVVHPLYQWLLKFKGLLISKFSLYFHDTLSRQAPAPEVKALMAKTSIDFLAKIATFQRKSDATCVSLILELTEMDEAYHGPGYHHPKKITDKPTGVDNFPAIFTFPGEKPDKLWPNVIMILMAKADELSYGEKIIYFFDERMQKTYFLGQVDPKMTMLVLFENKKNEKDTYVNNTLSELCAQLKGSRVLLQLRS
ncbi:hypothetical protein CAPTEDRAFT_174615 [Capitella teleta]|uniref:KICSTOR subunit 2 n=1 Tax=Capitella teleta TaxID=283909 RepID=R7TMD5_CAPTE|nr:hypothetical protein CAPTEDRAFT_174615 [Capitella teleta]|eukprot:ELT92245.1 hypothetical protein CAPTEDRAFT_174615 [Capitella teleta]